VGELLRPDWRLTWQHEDVIPWQPWAKKRPRISAPRAGQRPRTHQDPEDAKAEERLRKYFTQTILDHQLPPFTTNVAIGLRFFRQTAQVVDLDNLVKHFCDSANGVLWADDVLVTQYDHVRLELDRDNPRTEWSIRYHFDCSMVRSREFKTPK
jgi:Holliday junction resolvase RusA-like endonuclease